MQLIRFKKTNNLQAIAAVIITAGALFASVAGATEAQAAPRETTVATVAGGAVTVDMAAIGGVSVTLSTNGTAEEPWG